MPPCSRNHKVAQVCRSPSRFRASVLLVNGEHDLVLLPYATEMKNAIPGSRIEIIPGATHEVPVADPDSVNPIMLSFLKQES
jgi:pimeloyl-ACP methyl ester carboxylesterase